MATTRIAKAQWEGTLLEGRGTVEMASSGIGTFPITWANLPMDALAPRS
jgi:osmotically inducible protein OsmC